MKKNSEKKNSVITVIIIIITFIIGTRCENVEPMGACINSDETFCYNNMTEKECSEYDNRADWYSSETCEDRGLVEGEN
ncbi:MAG: hypothetical protein OEZ22_04105 [Spirochaetia bacterium]|nr:hypothetical protein [Spirochaetia bacterium]